MSDEGTINLREEIERDGAEFKLRQVEEQSDRKAAMEKLKASPVGEGENIAMKPYDKVKVRFDSFVNLIANHAYEDVFNKNKNEEVIISTNLLSELANAHEEKPDSKRLPFIFVFGIILGVVLAWILFRT